MKGIVFNLIEEVVRREHGEDAWDDLLASTGIDGAFTSLGTYPDEHLVGLVRQAARQLSMTEPDVLRWVGRRAMGLLAERYPGFFDAAPSAYAFLLTLNSIIHPEVRKLHPGADVPTFEVELIDDGGLRLAYRSNRRLCFLAEGFILGGADRFSERATVSQPECVHLGYDRCVLDVRFTALEGGRR